MAQMDKILESFYRISTTAGPPSQGGGFSFNQFLIKDEKSILIHTGAVAQFKGVTDQGSADFIYFNWTDRYGTLGLGPDLPMMVGTGSDSLQVHMPKTGERIILRVPYPLGFYSRGMSGRIDDPNAGWKGRGVFAAFSTQMLWQLEGGKGTRSKLVHFQMRPNPLAQ